MLLAKSDTILQNLTNSDQTTSDKINQNLEKSDKS